MIKRPSLLLMSLSLIICIGPLTVQAADPVLPDKNGDYFKNVSYTQGTVPSGKLQAGHLWKVVAPQLNCRAEASIQAPSVRQFKQGTVLQADVGRGGADEVLNNALASDKKPWMKTRSKTGQAYNCYVRANQTYIQPI